MISRDTINKSFQIVIDAYPNNPEVALAMGLFSNIIDLLPDEQAQIIRVVAEPDGDDTIDPAPARPEIEAAPPQPEEPEEPEEEEDETPPPPAPKQEQPKTPAAEKPALTEKQTECLETFIALDRAGIKITASQVAERMGHPEASYITHITAALKSKGYLSSSGARNTMTWAIRKNPDGSPYSRRLPDGVKVTKCPPARCAPDINSRELGI